MVFRGSCAKTFWRPGGLKWNRQAKIESASYNRWKGGIVNPFFFFFEWGHCFYMTFYFQNVAVIFKLCMARGWPVIRGQRVEGQNRQEFEDLFGPCRRACLLDPCSAWRGQPCGFNTGDKSPPDLRCWLGANLWRFAERMSINLHVSIYQYDVMHGCNLAPCFGCFISCII